MDESDYAADLPPDAEAAELAAGGTLSTQPEILSFATPYASLEEAL